MNPETKEYTMDDTKKACCCNNNPTFKVEDYIRIVPDFPKPGISFKDITPLLETPEAFRNTIDLFAEKIKDMPIDKIVAIDSRGFIFGAALAYKLNKGLVLVRKKGKLPHGTIEESYDLEYGSATLEIHQDSIEKGENVIIIDDVLATGGTIKATVNLVKKIGGKVQTVLFLIELGFLNGKEKLDVPHISLLCD